MEDKIRNLYCVLRNISIEYLYYQKKDNCEKILDRISDIQEFVEWFMSGNIFGIENQKYAELCNGLIEILRDILEAINQKDVVLLNDAIAFGLIDYLKLFLDEDEYSDDVI